VCVYCKNYFSKPAIKKIPVMLIFEVMCKKREKMKDISIMTSLQKYNALIMIIIVMITTIIIEFNSISMYLCVGLTLKMLKNKTLNRQKAI